MILKSFKFFFGLYILLSLLPLKGEEKIDIWSQKNKNNSEIDLKRDARKEAEKSLTPELINRLDEIIVFNYFSKEHIKTFFQKEIKELKIKLKKMHEITLDVDEKMVDYLTELAYNRKQGARPVRRIIQKNIENIASKWIINENKGTLKITKENNND